MGWARITIPACAGCCDPCALGTTLEVLFSGLVLCGDCYSDPFGPIAPQSAKYTAFSLAGPYSLTGPATGPWTISAVGSWAGTIYDALGCLTTSTDYTGTFDIQISCSGGDLTVLVFITDGSGWPFNGAGSFTGTGPIDTAISNGGDCSFPGTVMSGGTATVSQP